MSPSISSSNAAARSLQAFGLYLCVAGTGLLMAPGLLLAPLGLTVPTDVWVRMVGILALALGVCDVLAGRDAVASLIRWSVWRRLAAGVGIGLLVLLGLAHAALLLFAAVDIAAALWTAMAMRRDSRDPFELDARVDADRLEPTPEMTHQLSQTPTAPQHVVVALK